MRDIRQPAFNFYQFQLPLDKKGTRRGTPSSNSLRTSSRRKLYSSSASFGGKSGRGSSLPQSRESHECVAVDNKVHQKDSQHILVGSALRRPHATEYSPLDYQIMPAAGKAAKQPFRPKSSCTVYGYANRPVSACQLPVKHGKHTKSSLLRAKTASSASLSRQPSSASAASTDDSSRPGSANKRLCKIRDDYRLFRAGSPTKQVPPHGESLHSFLTGARYNNTRFLDSRTLSKLGMYIPKADLKSFFVKEEELRRPAEDSDDDDSYTSEEDNFPEDMSTSTNSIDELGRFSEKTKIIDEQNTKAVNTEPHYLSIARWHSADWKTIRKPTAERVPRAHTAPCRIKPIKAYYHDYDTGKKYNS